jgi:prepilin-type N-terminal cleavage/methylation domain-containing protein
VTSTIRRTATESGYSLVEVMVAIVVLTIAIVPMVGMFGAAIHASEASGEYDEARTCAVQKLEQAKTLPYETLEAGLQGGICEPSGFGYQVVSQPVGLDLGDGSGDEGLTMITVTVDWAGGNSYDVSGVVSRW